MRENTGRIWTEEERDRMGVHFSVKELRHPTKEEFEEFERDLESRGKKK